jgi:nucleotide-binding universal stress UspA family protein
LLMRGQMIVRLNKNIARGEGMELRLKVKIVESGRKFYEVAQSLGWHPSKLSHIIHGAMKPSPEEKAMIAKELNVDVAVVFPLLKEKLR